MSRTARSRLGALTALLVGSLGLAQERPSEADLFGAPPAPSTQEPTCLPTPDRPCAPDRPREDELFGAPPGTSSEGPATPAEQAASPTQTLFDTEASRDDPLKIGGTFYLRSVATVRAGDTVDAVGLSTPSLVDGYFDARPSDRVRGLVLARMRYDPTFDASQATGLGALPRADGVLSARSNPSIDLDQLWLRFDVARTVFVTAGKQHVKWGTSRFWNPTDFLSPERKDPLAVFDARLGANMLKLHLPWEERGWNFYAIGLIDHTGPANALGKLGVASRAEVVLGTTEIGADAVLVRGRRPRYGLDISSALGPLDVYAEAAIRSGADVTLWRTTGAIDFSQPLGAQFESFHPEGPVVQVSGGATYSFNYTENNAATVGVEYFFNPAGTEDPALYPWLIFQNQFQPFYAGRHYAAVYAIAMALPGSLEDVGVSVSNLGNLSDLSFVSRVDTFIRVLSYLNVEFYGAVHYGRRGGEFRFALDLPPLEVMGQSVPPLAVPPPSFEMGVGLRISL